MNTTPELDSGDEIKIVIWDLDETFWKGVLGEGTAEIIPKNVSIVKSLNDLGVVNAVCSKNDPKQVAEFFNLHGLDEIFVFSSVSYGEKSGGVRHILKSLSFRADNALFVDDNFHNREEVSHVFPKLTVNDIDVIDSLPSHARIRPSKSRVAKYKQVAARVEAQSETVSNVDFLRNSRIVVELISAADIDRIEEMVQRTNQLNFTKIRRSREVLLSQINDPNNFSAAVRVRDKFGDYGVCGFICANRPRNQLIHFLFSCRILGLGVEKFIYNYLGRPNIRIAQPVVEDLDGSEGVDWIALSDGVPDDHARRSFSDMEGLKIIFRGGCDISPVAQLFSSNGLDVVEDIGNAANQTQIRYLVDSRALSDAIKSEITKKIPFINDETYSSRMFSDRYDFAVISMVVDFSRIAYKHRDLGVSIFHEISQGLDRVPIDGFEDNMHFLHREWEKTGLQSPEQLEAVLKEFDVLELDVGHIIFLNGAEVPNVTLNDQHRKMNEVLDAFISRNPEKYSLVDLRRIVRDQSFLREENNIRHYVRSVYVGIYEEIERIIRSRSLRQ